MFNFLDPWAIWLIFSGILFVIEICTVSFFAFWPGIGALAAAISCIFTDNIVIQSTVFVVVSLIMILFMKPLAKRLFKTKDVPMNSKIVIEKNGIVVQEIDNLNSKGQVKVNGELWSAISKDGEKISKGSTVIIKSIEGVKLIVEKV